MRQSPHYAWLPHDGGTAERARLDPDQQRVVDHETGPLLVLAGPGTGKTTTLVEAIAQRIESGVRPEQVLALTFGRKAALELRERVAARLDRTFAAPICLTFHSFAFALLRRYAADDLYDAPLRLLTAAEQDVHLRELLADSPESVNWPPHLRPALATRGFAADVQQVLSRAREAGLDGSQLRGLGLDRGHPELVSAGAFLDQYLDVLDQQGSTDYADLVRRAQLEASRHRDELRATYSHVFVDEYQDTDPGQVALLQELAGDGRNLVVVGDPHQSIYAFRGARVRGILDFPAQFTQSTGDRAEVVTLRTTRRFGPNILAAATRVAERLPFAGSIDARARADFLSPVAEGFAHGEGKVEVFTFDTARAEAEHLADLLRRAHLQDGLAWRDMAVLVRSGKASIPTLSRALLAAGVPVDLSLDEVPLATDPAVRALLGALRAALNLEESDPSAPGFVTAETAAGLLTGPLGGLDAGELRVLARILRSRERKRIGELDATQIDLASQTQVARSSGELLRLAVVEEGFLAGLVTQYPQAAKAAQLSKLLATAAERIGARSSVDEVLWCLWSGTSWPARLELASAQPGTAARMAHRNLDAIVALFDLAARIESQRDHSGVHNFLEMLAEQQIPSDSMVQRVEAATGVRLLTAHRAKGLQWRLVVVAHVQQDEWPDLRRRGALLTDVLSSALGSEPTPKELLHEERRLFYVACTRARERLVVTAVRANDDEGESPSRFLDELTDLPAQHIKGRPRRALTMGALIADLRRTAADPRMSEGLREAAARRLARLTDQQGPRGPLAPTADPANWWGLAPITEATSPVCRVDEPVPVSASMLKAIADCPAKWFFSNKAGGRVASLAQANVGSLIHALAEHVALGDDAQGELDIDALMSRVDQVWPRLSFATPWSSARERDRVRLALERFLAWHQANPRQLIAAERQFTADVQLSSGDAIRIRGTIDRLEIDAQGALVVVDLKTGRRSISAKSVESDPQLALYQLAITDGDAVAEGAITGGAQIVQLGLDDSRPARLATQLPLEMGSTFDQEFRQDLAEIAQTIRKESFPATPGSVCDRCEFISICPAKSAGSVL
ncbi:MAG: ATP-dependent DNA helicase [Marmoricola sp.]